MRYGRQITGPVTMGEQTVVLEAEGTIVKCYKVTEELLADSGGTNYVCQEIIKKEMNLGRLGESGEGIASKRYGDPGDPMQYQAVPVYCPNPLCGKEKVVTGGTKTWPRCDDCDEPMRREHELPENQKV